MTTEAPRRPSPEVWIAAAAFVLWLVWAFRSPGTFNDDDVTHFFMARDSVHDPTLWLSLWGRPLFTFLYAWPAQLGYAAVEITTALVSAITLVMTAKVARLLDVRAVVPAVLFTAFQPFTWKLGYAGLVEPLAALVLLTGVWAFLEHRDRLCAVLLGLVPLTRLELIVVLPILLIPLWRRRTAWTMPLSAIGLLLWIGGGWLAYGEPLWLLDQLASNRFDRSFAGGRSLVHYFRAIPLWTGGAILPLFLLGLLEAERPRGTSRAGAPVRPVTGRVIVRALVVGVVVTLALLAWDAHDRGGSVGYLRHLVSIGPLIALLAARGVDRFPGAPRMGWGLAALALALCVLTAELRWDLLVWEHPVWRDAEPWIWTIACGGALGAMALHRMSRHWALGVALVAGATTLVAERPIGLDPERQAMADAVTWVKTHRPGRVVAVNHPWYFFLGGFDRNDPRFKTLDQATLATLPPGALVVWESHFGHRLSGDVSLRYFESRPDRYVCVAKDLVTRRPDLWPSDLGPPSDEDLLRQPNFMYLIFEVTGGGAR